MGLRVFVAFQVFLNIYMGFDKYYIKTFYTEVQTNPFPIMVIPLVPIELETQIKKYTSLKSTLEY